MTGRLNLDWQRKRRRLIHLLVAIMAPAVDVVAAEGRAAEPTFGTTVITHGYQFSGSLPAWPESLARAVRDRAGGGRIFRYRPGDGQLELIAGTPTESGETVLIFDWAADSNDSALGRSEAAAEALLAALQVHAAQPGSGIPLSPLHLIGHSRGTVVNSELAERLIALGFAVHHVTTLDPHDWGTAGLTGVVAAERTDWDVNAWHPEYPDYDVFAQPPGIQTWNGIIFADNYFQRSGEDETLFDPWGKPLPGAANLAFPDSFGIGHSEVHAWYHGTVDTATGDDGAGIFIPASWYDNPGLQTECSESFRRWTLERTSDGFWFSLLGGWQAAQCPESEYDPGVTRVPVAFSYGLPEGLVNGDFERGLSGWSLHGGELTSGAAVGNGVLDLNLAVGDEPLVAARHNRFYVPPDRTHIQLCLRVVTPDADDLFRVRIGATEVHVRGIAQTSTRCEAMAIELTGYRDSVQTLSLELERSGAGSGRVFVDNVTFLPSELVLVDGFESGDTWAWSSTVP